MEQFPHLKLIQKITGDSRSPRIPRKPNQQTINNQKNRNVHSNFLINKTNKIKSDWNLNLNDRERMNLAEIDKNTIPIFLQLDPDLLLNADFNLESYNIEIISELEDGFIIGASLDNLKSLESKISGFINNKRGAGNIAKFWNIIDGDREEWKPKHILSENLFSIWHSIQDDVIYNVEVSIAIDKPIGKEPNPNKQGYENRLKSYQQKLLERDNLILQREEEFCRFINTYGKLKSDIIHLEDSFGCEVEIEGIGLKDLTINYPYVFEINEIETIESIQEIRNDEYENLNFDILPPEEDSPTVGVIDSGIMEDHKYLSLAIDSENSKSYVISDTSVADMVKNNGHGTIVAGAMLFPNGIDGIKETYQLPFYIRNLKILDESNQLHSQYPATLMQKIVEENENCDIYNLSINSYTSCRNTHMSTWATTIDKLIHEKEKLFIISVGNIPIASIKYYLRNNNPYPNYLYEPFCRLANPSQSLFGITVGSINYDTYEDNNYKSIGEKEDISAFSRVGLGIWNSIKPDVVEFGGGIKTSKDGGVLLTTNTHNAPSLVQSNLHGGNSHSKNNIGTSFSTPKVTNIVTILRKLYPTENINLLRALLVQGSRLPEKHFQNPIKESIQFYGYGIPSLERVTKNTEQRITFYTTSEIKTKEGHIYSLKIPDNLRKPEDSYDILIEVTLAYTAKVRRTRQKTRSYLATWLDWNSSRLNESYEKFKPRVLANMDDLDNSNDEENNIIHWKIREQRNWGDIKGINRNDNTIQKDWAIMKSHELPEEICFVIRGHKGWDKNQEEIPYAFSISIEVLGTNLPIYELIKVENEIEISI